MGRVTRLLAITWLFPAGLWGQTLGQRISEVSPALVHLSFASRPGVCGDGRNTITTKDETEDWVADCEAQPVRVSLQIEERRVVALKTYVGRRWRPGSSARDLGTVRPQEAASYFLDLAGRADELDGDPILPASLADSAVIWPALLRLARNERLPEERRKSAVFWLGQAAEAAVDGALDSIVHDDRGDLEVRKHAVFALSQRSSAEAVPALIHIARTNRDPELRKTALFWLGQSEDPRALDLFEEILR